MTGSKEVEEYFLISKLFRLLNNMICQLINAVSLSLSKAIDEKFVSLHRFRQAQPDSYTIFWAFFFHNSKNSSLIKL